MRSRDHQDHASFAEIEQYLVGDTVRPPVAVPGDEPDSRARAARLLAALGDPQNAIPAIHVAGTAGKGSVCAFVTAVLRAHGFRVGTYTSPHVHSLLERFQLNGASATVEAFVPALRVVREQVAELGGRGPTMFEAATVAAFVFFERERVDYGVVETGIGGLRDATNTITRRDKLAVLTSIGFDHTEILGDTLGEIATQKAGILAEGGDALALAGGVEVDAAIAAEAAHRDCFVRMVAPATAAAIGADTLGNTTPQRHQRINAGLALLAVERLAFRDGWIVDPIRAVKALRGVHLPGRFERMNWFGHQLVLDGAHNPLKLAALVASARIERPGRKLVWVLAMKADKSTRDMMRLLAPVARAVVVTEYDFSASGRGRGSAAPASMLAAEATGAGIESVWIESTPVDALRRATELTRDDDPVIVTGSFYLVADVAEAVR
ncbi:bifunctional folylpolyglutamate synthase/dihydrofolate synthase [Nocardia aobensis]|uniref:tetrahydrofolate synthase n=1 Tax=Nocardia aobensis TaxID=257277 RepID=A0ABW6PF60_9NOCA